MNLSAASCFIHLCVILNIMTDMSKNFYTQINLYSLHLKSVAWRQVLPCPEAKLWALTITLFFSELFKVLTHSKKKEALVSTWTPHPCKMIPSHATLFSKHRLADTEQLFAANGFLEGSDSQKFRIISFHHKINWHSPRSPLVKCFWRSWTYGGIYCVMNISEKKNRKNVFLSYTTTYTFITGNKAFSGKSKLQVIV